MNRGKAPALIEGMRIMETVAESERPVPFHVLSANSGMSKASVTRLLKDLTDTGYLKSEAREGYSLGMRFFYLIKTATGKRNPLQQIIEKIKELAPRLSASLQFAVYDPGQPAITILAKSDCEDCPFLAGPGNDITSYSHRHALGRAIMAYLDIAAFERISRRVEAVAKTSRTIMPGPDLAAALIKVVELGISYENQECVEGIQRVAVPIFDSKGSIHAGLCASWFSPHFNPEESDRRAVLLQECSAAIAEIISSGGAFTG